MDDPGQIPIEPKIRLRDGRVIGSIKDAIALLREHESRPGVDDRDEVLHRLERAQTEQELHTATRAFLAWATELGLASPPKGSGTRTEPSGRPAGGANVRRSPPAHARRSIT